MTTRAIAAKAEIVGTEGYTPAQSRPLKAAASGPERKARGFTATRLATMPPGRYKDPGQKSLYLLVRDRAGGKPSRTWLHRVKYKGGDSFLTVGHFPETSLEKARDAIRKQRELLSKGIDPKTAAPRRRPVRSPQSVSAAAVGDGHSIEFLAHEFLDLYVRKEHKRPAYVEAILNKDVLPEWKGRNASTIKPREVIELLDKIVTRGKKVMANRTAAVLGQMFKFGIHRQIVDDSPVKLLMRPGGKEKPRQRVLSDTELAAFLKDPLACTRQHRLTHVIKILLLTATRRGELAQARWRDIDLDAGTWTLPAANTKKMGVTAVVPLTPWAVEEFKKLKLAAGRSQWVLPGTDPSEHIEPKLLTRAPAKCAARFKKAGIAPFTLHDLRRTVRTGLGRLKIAQHIAELCLNHAQPGIVGTYDVHAYTDEKRAALQKWADHLKSLTP